MNKCSVWIIVGILGCMLNTHPAWAWGAAGHQTSGAIADGLLVGTRAAKQVKMILRMNLRTASLWADCAKGVSENSGSFTYTASQRFPECRTFETPAGKARMVDFVQRNWDGCHPVSGADPCHKQYHYTDVAILRSTYSKSDAGTGDHDLISALGAAIIVLQGGLAPKPFNIKDKKEALLLLAHYVGDVHQPLHVGAIYLDAVGREVDPDAGLLDPATQTRGGNQLVEDSHNLHAEWDAIPVSLDPRHFGKTGVANARKFPMTAGAVADWPVAWASETLGVSHEAFEGVTFAPENTTAHTWAVTLPVGYAEMRTQLQRQQLLAAGARLAQVLQAVFP